MSMRARPFRLVLPAAIAAAHFLLHMLTNGNYGIFRDEFYYLDCADHLTWGYVDHPPLSIFLLAAVRSVLGDSIHAIRLLPALAGSAAILLTGRLAAELGGGRGAQALAALCVAVVPVYLVLTGFFSMNAFDLVVWATAFLLLARLIRTGRQKLWLWLGLVLGLGLLNKISVLFLGAGLVVGVLLSPLRSHLRRPHIWLGGGIALLLFLPHILWQIAHGWPTLEFIRNATLYKNVHLAPHAFLGQQVLQMHPLAALAWIMGLAYLLIIPDGRRFAALGWIYVTALVVMMLQNSKPYYLAVAYPALFAAGGVAWEQLARGPGRRWILPSLAAVITLGGIVLMPFGVPLIGPDALVRYQRSLGLEIASGERGEQALLPQYFADRFGWEEMAAAVGRIYEQLPAEERRVCGILAGNYGEAGAINYYGRRYGLPRAISGHNSHYLWGPGDTSGEVLICIGIDPEAVAESYGSVDVAGRLDLRHAMPYERRRMILICRDPKRPIGELWPKTKHFA